MTSGKPEKIVEKHTGAVLLSLILIMHHFSVFYDELTSQFNL